MSTQLPLVRTGPRLCHPLLVNVLVVLTTASFLGCSWVAVKKAPRNIIEGKRPRCTEKRFAPALDTIIAVPYALTAAGVILVTSTIAQEEEDSRDAMVVGFAVAAPAAALALAFGSSARYGYRETSRCRKLRDRAAEAQRNTGFWEPGAGSGLPGY